MSPTVDTRAQGVWCLPVDGCKKENTDIHGLLGKHRDGQRARAERQAKTRLGVVKRGKCASFSDPTEDSWAQTADPGSSPKMSTSSSRISAPDGAPVDS